MPGPIAELLNDVDNDPSVTIGRISVLFVCYGNICRSPIGEFVFKRMVEEKGLSERFRVESAGTSGEHIGDNPDRRAASVLASHGISCAGKTSRRILRPDFLDFDYIVCMDRMNLDYLHRMSPPNHVGEISLLMDYADGGEVADPYYTGDFEKAYRDIERGCRGLMDHILSQHPELVPRG